MRMSVATRLSDEINQAARPLTGENSDFDPLLERIELTRLR